MIRNMYTETKLEKVSPPTPQCKKYTYYRFKIMTVIITSSIYIQNKIVKYARINN